MKKKVVDKLKKLYFERRLEFLILYILSTIKNEKFVSRQYIDQIIDLKKESMDIMMALSRMTREKTVENHSLFKYRMRQKNLDKIIVDENYETLFSLGLVPANRRYSLNEDELAEIRKNTPAEIRKQLDWLDDVKNNGKTKLTEFINSSIIGPVNIVSSPTQSVFRITEKGLSKLKLYERQFGKI